YHDVLVALLDFLYTIVERFDQFHCAVLDFWDSPHTGPIASFHGRRIGPEHERGRRFDLAAVDREVHRQVVPLDPPAPFPGLGRLAEDAHEIPVGITNNAALLLHFPEDGLEAHNGRRLIVTPGARAGA